MRATVHANRQGYGLRHETVDTWLHRWTLLLPCLPKRRHHSMPLSPSQTREHTRENLQRDLVQVRSLPKPTELQQPERKMRRLRLPKPMRGMPCTRLRIIERLHRFLYQPTRPYT